MEVIFKVFAQLVVGLLLRFRGSKSTKKLEAVADFDFEKFLGTWYLVAYIPPPFHKRMNAASTEFSVDGDGTIRVTNRSYDEKKGKWNVQETTGQFKENQDTGWFVVETNNPLDENRKIIYLNEDYSQAIIVGLLMRTLWIVYRDEHLEMRDVSALIAKAGELGFKTRKLVRVEQKYDWKSGH